MVIHSYKKAAQLFTQDKIGVIPTDTIYGISCIAKSPNLVKQIYKIKNRDLNKPCILLINNISNLKYFKINLTKELQEKLKSYWPGPTSIIIPCPYKEFKYLHKGTNQLAFRIPKKDNLLNLLKISGPIISTSANVQGKLFAKTIKEAQSYFKNSVDFYLDAGVLEASPSRVLKYDADLRKFKQLR